MVCWLRSRSRAAKAVAAAEPGEPVGEAVVVEVDGQDGFAQQGGEGALVLGDPGLDVVEAVVALGEEEEEPDGQDLAGGERAFPVERGGEVAVQGGRQVQTLQGGPQDGQVGHDFDTQQAGFGWCSSLQSTHLPLSRKPPRTRANRR